jgi:hypothetical protein
MGKPFPFWMFVMAARVRRKARNSVAISDTIERRSYQRVEVQVSAPSGFQALSKIHHQLFYSTYVIDRSE